MRHILVSALLIASMALLAGCKSNSGSALTTEKVQAAVDKAVAKYRQDGSAVVTGIQEKPQENAAQVDIGFEGFKYKSQIFGLRTYTGKGIGELKHYTDGRWVLTKITIVDSFDQIPGDITIE